MSDCERIEDEFEVDPEWECFIRGANEMLLLSGWIVFLHRYIAFDLRRREPSMYWEVRRLRERASELGLTQISLEIEPELLVMQWCRDKPFDICTRPPYWEHQLPRAHSMSAAHVAEEIPTMLREWWPGTWSRTDRRLESRGLEFDAEWVPGEPVWPAPPVF
jgi:hypothetical protein